MRQIFLRAVLSLLALLIIAPASADAARGLPKVRVGFVLDGEWGRYEDTLELFKRELTAVNEAEFDVQFPAGGTVDGGWSVEGVRRAVDGLLASRDVDIVIALGHVSSHEIARREKLQKPVIAPFILDAGLQGLPAREGVSGRKNLNYIDMLRNVGMDIGTFHDVVPFRSLAIVADALLIEAMPALKPRAAQVAEEEQIEIRIVSYEGSAEQVFAALSPGTDAVMVAPLFRASRQDFQALVSGLIERKLPGYSFWGRNEVEKGLLATTVPEDQVEQLARHVAVNVHDILRGKDAGTLPVVFMPDERLAVNMETARAIGVYPSLSIRTEAELINEERKDIERTLTLQGAVQEALKANLDLAVAKQSVLAGSEAVKEARSVLLPQVDVSSQALHIDDDRARAAQGVSPERTWTGTAGFNQLIYSDRAWTGYSVEKHFQDARVESRETVRLDITQASSVAYLDVLRARTIERIQKDNLMLTRANLERARVRVSVGIAGPDEIYRWESEIAVDRQAVLDAESATLSAMQALNRILNRPVEEPFVAGETSLRDPLLVVGDRLFYMLVNNPGEFRHLRAFMVGEGLSLSPELKQFDAEIAAQERIQTFAKRDFYLPDFSVRGSVTELFADSGDGARDDFPGDLDDTEWQVGVLATFPLFTGGQKTATYSRSREELLQLTLAREATAERIEERIQGAINRTRASYPAIRLTRDASEAANRNLELVLSSYQQGIKTIIDVLDAQNLSLSADLRAANAVYDFLIDLMNLQRAVGRFDFFLGVEEQEAWLRRFQAFSEAGGQVR
jgi:outer membrane protein TolC